MTPYYADEWLSIFEGDCRAVLRSLPAESVHAVVTSPPYWGLRSYGIGADNGELGLEATPEAYVAALVDVFRDVRRVLRSDGTVWLNLGDSYTANPGSGQARGESTFTSKRGTYDASDVGRGGKAWQGLPGKNLVGIPWRVAFALQADGWYLRSDIIWSKPNPMPESVTDRPTKSHEYVFLLSKSARYFFDADAVREPNIVGEPIGTPRLLGGRQEQSPYRPGQVSGKNGHNIGLNPAGRNIRSVWTIATAPYPGAHFATFPPKLVEPCIKAGCPDKACGECGAPWERVVERTRTETRPDVRQRNVGGRTDGFTRITAGGGIRPDVTTTTGFRPTCNHDASAVPGTVLDPFAGTGTVGLVAQRLSRRAVLIDLNAEYLAQCLARNAQTPLGLESA